MISLSNALIRIYISSPNVFVKANINAAGIGWSRFLHDPFPKLGRSDETRSERDRRGSRLGGVDEADRERLDETPVRSLGLVGPVPDSDRGDGGDVLPMAAGIWWPEDGSGAAAEGT